MTWSTNSIKELESLFTRSRYINRYNPGRDDTLSCIHWQIYWIGSVSPTYVGKIRGRYWYMYILAIKGVKSCRQNVTLKIRLVVKRKYWKNIIWAMTKLWVISHYLGRCFSGREGRVCLHNFELQHWEIGFKSYWETGSRWW